MFHFNKILKAIAIVEYRPIFKRDVYLPYARWLSENDQFDEAQSGIIYYFKIIFNINILAYNIAGEEKEAFDVLNQLTENALRESRFYDASCYYRIKASQLLDYYAKTTKIDDSENLIKNWINFNELADIYFAYDAIFKYSVFLN